MLQGGHPDPFKVAFNSLEVHGCFLFAGLIGHMVLMDNPNELRVGYIGQVDLIS